MAAFVSAGCRSLAGRAACVCAHSVHAHAGAPDSAPRSKRPTEPLQPRIPCCEGVLRPGRSRPLARWATQITARDFPLGGAAFGGAVSAGTLTRECTPRIGARRRASPPRSATSLIFS
eukprot:270746-Chlamydomonas_euryale.AAC.3